MWEAHRQMADALVVAGQSLANALAKCQFVVDMIYSVSGIQQSDSLVHYMCKSVFFKILFHCKLLQDTEYSSLCSTVGPCYMFYI